MAVIKTRYFKLIVLNQATINNTEIRGLLYFKRVFFEGLWIMVWCSTVSLLLQLIWRDLTVNSIIHMLLHNIVLISSG